jgi:NADPH:quinone reductase-like Zn-dependent oxidoreductase
MKAMCLSDGGQTLVERDLPTPTPQPHEILIRVHAAGVTPTEVLWYPTTHTKAGTTREHAVPGHEFSGVIEACGDAVRDFHAGQEVYGMNDWFDEGATAEYCVTVPASIAPKPARLTHEEAATVSIGALTAWQGLFTKANLVAGERVLIHGGSGAVGLLAIQLAKRAGGHVITTASSQHAALLQALGADQVLDYKTQPFEETLHDIDVIFDAVGGTTLQRSWSVLKAGGRLVTIAADSEGTADERTKAAFFIVEPHQQQLVEIGSLLETGALRAFVGGTVPLALASDAYFGRPPRIGLGKFVVSVQ